MGLFLTGTAMWGVDGARARAALEAWAGSPAQPEELAESPAGTTVVYPSDFFEWDEVSAWLSTHLGTPVLSFHVHDGDLWMVRLFVAGDDVARYNPLPGYWAEVPPEEHARWAGDAEVMSRHLPGVTPASVERYFVPWSDAVGGKAYPDDEFPTGDPWQVADFLTRLGLVYPEPEPLAPDPPAPSTKRAPWWRRRQTR